MNTRTLTRSDVEVRTPVAILSAGPHRPEVTTMVDDLERQGQPVTLVCLDNSRHEHEATRADLLHVPLLSAAVLSSLIVRLIKDPGHIVRVFIRLLVVMAAPRVALAALLRLPVAIHLARILPRRGLTDLQPFDPVASKVAFVIRNLSDSTPPDLSELPVEWSRLRASRVSVRWFSRRINCIAAEVSVDDDSRRLIVKRQRGDAVRSEVDRALHEYRVLGSLAEMIDDTTLTVPRVLLFNESAATLVMERAQGKTLDTFFAATAANAATVDRLADGIRGAGAWLAAMQMATRREADGTVLLGELVATAIADAEMMAATTRSLRWHHRRIVQRLRILERRVSRRLLTVTGHHGDYWPGNIFIDGRRITVIDFEGFRDGVPLEDVAYFLIRCEMLRRRFRLPYPNVLHWFLEGYSDGQQPDAEALELFTLTKGLRTLANGTGLELPMPQRIYTRSLIRKAVLGAMRD